MARRARPSASEFAAAAADAPRTEAEQIVAFRIGADRFGFRLSHVAEIIRPPKLAPMPLAPASLLGLANLRGVVLPVISLRRLLGHDDAASREAARVVVIGGDAPLGFLVDRIEHLRLADRLSTDDFGGGGLDPALLDGVVRGAEGEDSLKILNPQRLLRDQFARLAAPRAPAERPIAMAPVTAVQVEARVRLALLSFALGTQDYALPLDRIEEVIALPDHVAEMPRPETAVLGVMTLRDRLLPLVSLRALLGFSDPRLPGGRGKVIVVSLGAQAGAVGVVVDRTRDILRVDPNLIDPAPALLTRGAGEAEIVSICRLDGGRRLVALLSTDRLFRSDLVARLLTHRQDEAAAPAVAEEAMADQQFIVFRLGEQEFGLPIEAVEEVARAPERVTPLPRAPAFIDGVMNLRGEVLPIVDLRRRFAIAAAPTRSGQRVLVLATGGGRTGFLVDAVSEILKAAEDAIVPAPDVLLEQARLIHRVITSAQGRMILLIDPAYLLERIEADVLSQFDRGGADASSPAP